MSNDKKEQTSMASIHDFGAKLQQPSMIDSLKEYVRWQIQSRQAASPADYFSQGPDKAPVSINLDLTTSCNYACDHCVDQSILNTGIRFKYEQLCDSLDLMCKKGLRSVIIIGGGEPTVDPNFEHMIKFLKERDVHIAVVTNGSGMQKIRNVAHLFGDKDWVRLSLDSGTDATFQAMHNPKKAISLEEICAEIPKVREVNPSLRIGFSFIVTWQGAETNDTKIIENLDEIVAATTLARDNEFSYISIKPFLDRAEGNNAEVMGITDEWNSFNDIIARIRKNVDLAKALETETFKVVESSNLRVLENNSYRDYTNQPKHCHMQFFRQVLSPLGTFNCPVYRHVEHAKVGDSTAFATLENFQLTKQNVAALVQDFDATAECKEVTCLYNPVNWAIEDLIEHPEKLDQLEASPEREDFFL